jgi:hypothetical protein
MTYFKCVMSGVAAAVLAILLHWALWAVRDGNLNKAVGLGAVVSTFAYPTVWLLAFGLFAVFFFASGARHRVLRILLFWVPTSVVVSIFVVFAALVTLLVLHARPG